MAYELEDVEKKVSTEQLKKKLILFNDNQENECKNLCFFSGSKYKAEQSFKAATYKLITKEFQDYFAGELLRIRTSLANHRINDPVDKFSRYINTNYLGLLKLLENGKYNKPLKVNFNSPRFRYMYEKVTLHQIHYDLQNLFVDPLKKTFEEEYQAEINPSPYVYAISKQEDESSSNLNPGNTRLKWRGAINVLVTLYYDLANDKMSDGTPYLSATTHEIADHILNNFTDKNGNELNRETILTILRPGKTDKRAPEHKKYKLPF